jgi:CheY-like chemotaxis protein
MSDPKRLVLVDNDPAVASELRSVLGEPDFEVHAFTDPREALLKLHDVAPDLILCSLDIPVMPGRSFMRVVKRSELMQSVPFIFLSADHTRDDMIDCLEDGADELLSKPLDTPVLVAKLRAMLRMAYRHVAPDERSDAVTGSVGPEGALRLLRFCEDFRLTGQLTVEGPEARHWAEFSGGELVRAGRDPEQTGVDPLDALLSIQSGAYRIEQRRIDLGALPGAHALDEAPAEVKGRGVHLPGGRLSMVESRNGNLQIQTEGENRPNFTVTTVIVRGGQVLRRIEAAWQHPLQRRNDEAIAKQQIDQQHDRVVGSLRDLALEGAPRREGAPKERGVDGRLLAWATERIAERTAESLGSVAAVALLRRTHKQALGADSTLGDFTIEDSGELRFTREDGLRVTRETMMALAGWLRGFLREASEMRNDAGKLDVREATHSAGDDLERAGFYEAFETTGA